MHSVMAKILVTALMFISTLYVSAQIPYNGDFEYVNLEHYPLVWTGGTNLKNYTVQAQSDIVYSGKKALRIQPRPGKDFKNARFLIFQRANFAGFTGARVRLELFFHLVAGDTSKLNPFINISCGNPIDYTIDKKLEVIYKNNIKWYKGTFETNIDLSCTWKNFGFIGTDSIDIVIDNFSIYLDNRQVKDIALSDYKFPGPGELQHLQDNLLNIGNDTISFSDIDFSFLKNDLKNARIVALGESTHGTKEFNLLRMRLAEYLVKNMDFRVIVFENDFAGTLLAQPHFNNNGRDVRTGLDSFFTRVHQTTELEQLINTINSHHKGSTIPVEIYGCDVQSYAGPVLYLKRWLPPSNKTLINQLDSIVNYAGSRAPNYETTDTLFGMCKQAYQYFTSQASITKNGKQVLLEQVFKSLVDAAWFNNRKYAYQKHENMALGSIVRDSLMALYTEWLYSYTNGKKIILWAHNSHIQKNDSTEPENLFMDIKGMGACLKKAFGNSYKAYAFLTGSGTATGYSINRGIPQTYHLAKPDSTCYEYYLQKSSSPVSFVRIPPKKNFPVLKWRSIGFNPPGNQQQFFYYKLNDKFNGIFFIRTSTPAGSFHFTN